MYSNIIVSVIGLLVFLFIFWQKLKEDYLRESIFSGAFLAVAGLLAGLSLSQLFFKSWWFWFSFWGMVAGLIAAILFFKFKLFETLEAGLIALLPWLDLVFLNDAVTRSELTSFIIFSAVAFLIALYNYVNINYKSFVWYKSGKAGIAGISVAALFFLLRTAVAYFTSGMLSFVGKLDSFVSAVFFLIFLIGGIYLTNSHE